MSDCSSPALAWTEHSDADPPISRSLPWALPLGCCDVPEDTDPTLWLGLQAAAIEAVDKATHRTYHGPCRYEVRPCSGRFCTCSRLQRCCCNWDKLDLQQYLGRPLVAVIDVSVNCCAIDEAGNWRLDNGRYLTPIKKGALWPWPRQDLNLNPGDEGTWWIQVLAGREPNQLVLQAAADVACNLLKRCNGDDCDVPTNAVSVTRDGVTVTLQTGMLKGIASASLVLDLYGVQRKRQRIFDPTGPKAAIRPMDGTGFPTDGFDDIVVSDTAPADTTVVWIDTSNVGG